LKGGDRIKEFVDGVMLHVVEEFCIHDQPYCFCPVIHWINVFNPIDDDDSAVVWLTSGWTDLGLTSDELQ
jgi:hypothetical protein